MKFAASLILVSVVLLTACNNLVTRRDLYSGTKPNGPYTEARRTGRLPSKYQTTKKATPTPKPEEKENPLAPLPQ